MTTIAVNKKSYTTAPMYQWDLHRTLRIYGFSLPGAVEVHFAYTASETAAVKQATVDSTGVITVQVPDHLLRRSGKLHAYVYVADGETERTVCDITIPVKTRAKPADYIAPDDSGAVTYKLAVYDGAGSVTWKDVTNVSEEGA